VQDPQRYKRAYTAGTDNVLAEAKTIAVAASFQNTSRINIFPVLARPVIRCEWSFSEIH